MWKFNVENSILSFKKFSKTTLIGSSEHPLSNYLVVMLTSALIMVSEQKLWLVSG